jgi:hypothetical protein
MLDKSKRLCYNENTVEGAMANPQRVNEMRLRKTNEQNNLRNT